MGQQCGKIYKLLCTEYRSSIGETWVKEHSGDGTLHGNSQLPQKVQEGFQLAIEIISGFHFVIAIGILIFGVYTYSLKEEMSTGNTRTTEDAVIKTLNLVPNYLIGIGCIIAVVSLVGAAGVMRHHLPIMSAYMIVLFLYTIAQLVLVCLAFTMRTRIDAAIHDYFKTKGIANYRDDIDLQNLIDFVQMKFKCCGGSDTNGYLDWSNNVYFNCSTSNPSNERCGVPYTCCTTPLSAITGGPDLFCGANAQSANVLPGQTTYFYTDGCVDAVYSSIQRYGSYLVAAICGLIIVPIVLEIMMVMLIIDVHEEQVGYFEWEQAIARGDRDAIAIKAEVDAGEIVPVEEDEAGTNEETGQNYDKTVPV